MQILAMIHFISIENFVSIAERQDLDFKVLGNAPDLLCFRPSAADENTRLPVTIGFFGPNASGKSTILWAMVSTIAFIWQSFNHDDPLKFFQSYRQEKWWKKPTKITIEFDSNLSIDAPSVKFRYELHVKHEDNNLVDKNVAYEALFYAPNGRFRRLFERKGQEFYFSEEFGIFHENDPRKESIRPNASVISTLMKFNHKICQHIAQQIKIYTNMLGSGEPRQGFQFLFSHYYDDKESLEHLNKVLRRLDVGLESMNVEKAEKGFSSYFKHVGLDRAIFWSEESTGTQRFIEIFPLIYEALKTGGVVIIDELDNDLHPLLIPEVFRWFTDPERNPYGAQLFFTAHNPALLDELEKEQVFLVTKPTGKATQVYCAKDIKGLRREPSLMKKYLLGELGAVPHIG